jgi:serine/threonine protein kinase
MDPSEKPTFKKSNGETRIDESTQFPAAYSDSDHAPDFPPLPGEFAVGAVIADGRYKIISTIGRGAMGSVYEVEQTFMKKRLAMKLLLAGQVSDHDLKRFQKEAQAASRLDHPNLVHAVDFGMLGGNQPYLVMDLVRGTTLANYIKTKGPLPVELAVDIFIPVCLGLDYAHHEGVVHRDLKPSNIILEGKSSQTLVPKIVDFGIAKVNVQEETALTQIGEVLGTPLYMSPEQCAGEPVDFKSDIYSLGCVIFESLTGTPPFSGKNSLVTMMSHRSAKPPSLKEASLGFNFPRALECMMEKMLAKNPLDRYSSCMEIAQDFEYLKRGEFDKIASTHKGAANQKGVEANKHSQNVNLRKGIIGGLVTLSLLILIGIVITLFKPSPSAPGSTSSSVASPVASTSATRVHEDLEADLPFADVKEGSFCHAGRDLLLYAFPNNDVIGTLYWWGKDAAKPGEHPAQGIFNTPSDAKPVFDIGWNVIDNNGTYLKGFVDDFLYGAIINIRADWGIWGNDDVLTKSLKLLENQSQSLRILELVTKQTKGFSFNKSELNSLNKLSLVQWMIVRNCALSGEQLVKFDVFPRLKVLVCKRMAGCSIVLDKLRFNKNIQRLSLFDCKVHEDDLPRLSYLRSLRYLELRQIEVLEVGQRNRSDFLEQIANLPNLEELCIDSWNVQDVVDQKHLAKMRKLRVLQIADSSSIDSKVVPELIKSIQEKLPNCKIELIPHEQECTFREWCDPLKTNPGRVISWD